MSRISESLALIPSVSIPVAGEDGNAFSEEILALFEAHGVNLCQGYAEPGSPKGIVLLADWNKKELAKVQADLEAHGHNCDWEDEHASCHECGKAVRIQPDSYYWKPWFVTDQSEGSLLCLDCHKEELPEAEEIEELSIDQDSELRSIGLNIYQGV
jgi:hypothetical protein